MTKIIRFRFSLLLGFALGALSLFVLVGMDSFPRISWAEDGTFQLQYSAKPMNSRIPSCIDNFLVWNFSPAYKQRAGWNLDFVPAGSIQTTFASPQKENFIDINGDGLVDYLYTWNSFTNFNQSYQACVYLNTGAGFEKEYKCVVSIVDQSDSSKDKFYGDCADMSHPDAVPGV